MVRVIPTFSQLKLIIHGYFNTNYVIDEHTRVHLLTPRLY